MKNIGIIGAQGRLGSILVDKLKETDLHVTSIVRKNTSGSINNILEKNLFDLTRKDIDCFDCVICCYKSPNDNPSEVIDATKYLINLFNHSAVRLIIAGGSGVLKNSKNDIPLSESTELQKKVKMNPKYVPGAKYQLAALNILKNYKTFNWTYMAPAAILDNDTDVNNSRFRFTGEYLGFNSNNKSIITYNNYADSILYELNKTDNYQVIGVVSD